MKINNKHHSRYSAQVAALFKARANPWAHKYEPDLWNDCSHTAYEMNLTRYGDVFDKVRNALGTSVDRPAALAALLRKYSDNNLSLVTGKPEPEIAVMRRNFMHFLNTTCLSTNCYAYGLNIRHGFRPGDLLTPGCRDRVGGDCNVGMIGARLRDVFDGLAKDGIAVFNGNPNRDRAPDGFYLTALLVHHDEQRGRIRDFHFIRYDRDGGCSHKLGHEYVSRSYMGKDIIDPTQPGAFGDYKYEACLLVPAVLPQHQLKM